MKTRSFSCLQRGYSVVKEPTKKNPPCVCLMHPPGSHAGYTPPDNMSRSFCAKTDLFSPLVCSRPTGSSCFQALPLTPSLSTKLPPTLSECARNIQADRIQSKTNQEGTSPCPVMCCDTFTYHGQRIGFDPPPSAPNQDLTWSDTEEQFETRLHYNRGSS